MVLGTSQGRMEVDNWAWQFGLAQHEVVFGLCPIDLRSLAEARGEREKKTEIPKSRLTLKSQVFGTLHKIMEVF